MTSMSVFHPDLKIGRFIPGVSLGPRSTWLMQRLPARPHKAPEDLLVDDSRS